MSVPESNLGISAAFEAWIESLEDKTDGQGRGMLGDWIAVVCMVEVDEEGDPRAQYYLAMKDGTMLPHIGEGMLRQGLKELEANRSEE